MTREERIDWLCRLRGQLIYFNMPDHWRINFTHALSDEINDLQQDPCEPVGNSDKLDCISRRAVLNAIIKELCIKDENYLLQSEKIIYDVVKNMPPANPQEQKTDILDKIRTEIESKYGQCDICEYFEDYDYEENDISEYRSIGNIDDILQIIDKYRQEV